MHLNFTRTCVYIGCRLAAVSYHHIAFVCFVCARIRTSQPHSSCSQRRMKSSLPLAEQYRASQLPSSPSWSLEQRPVREAHQRVRRHAAMACDAVSSDQRVSLLVFFLLSLSLTLSETDTRTHKQTDTHTHTHVRVCVPVQTYA